MNSKVPMQTVPELKKILFEVIERLPVQIEYERVNAQIVRARFLALKAQGFTDAEALYLCKDSKP